MPNKDSLKMVVSRKGARAVSLLLVGWLSYCPGWAQSGVSSKVAEASSSSRLPLPSEFMLTRNGPLSEDGQEVGIVLPVTPKKLVPQEKETAKTAPNDQTPKDASQPARLEGRVSEEAGLSPLLLGTVQTIPAGTKIDLKVQGDLNSEIAQKGDEVWAQVSTNIVNGERVFVPGGWVVHGHVTDAGSPHRNGRAGYVEVQFDKLIRPDADPAKQIELPFETKFSTHDKKLTAVTKVLMHDTRYAAVGAYGGALLAFQLGGIPTAISTYGIDIGVGAGIGAGIGLYGAWKKKGDILSYFPGDEMHLVTEGSITLPGFNPTAIPSAEAPKETPHLNLSARNAHFAKDKLGDKLCRELSFDATIYNGTTKEFSFFDLSVLSDHDQRYYPSVAMIEKLKQKVGPHTAGSARLTFTVDRPERKYRLVLIDRAHDRQIAQAAIN
jgi:hypothetical protein